MSRRAIHEQLQSLQGMTEEAPSLQVTTSTLPAPVERTRRTAAPMRAQGLEKSDLAGKLEYLSGRALDRADDLLAMEIDNESDEKFGEKVRGLNSAIKTVLQTQVRVDEHRLKARSLDALPGLLEAIREEEAKQVKTVAHTAPPQ